MCCSCVAFLGYLTIDHHVPLSRRSTVPTPTLGCSTRFFPYTSTFLVCYPVPVSPSVATISIFRSAWSASDTESYFPVFRVVGSVSDTSAWSASDAESYFPVFRVVWSVSDAESYFPAFRPDPRPSVGGVVF